MICKYLTSEIDFLTGHLISNRPNGGCLEELYSTFLSGRAAIHSDVGNVIIPQGYKFRELFIQVEYCIATFGSSSIPCFISVV